MFKFWRTSQPANYFYDQNMLRLYTYRRRPILESAIVLSVVVHMVVRSVDVEVVVLLLGEVDIPS